MSDIGRSFFEADLREGVAIAAAVIRLAAAGLATAEISLGERAVRLDIGPQGRAPAGASPDQWTPADAVPDMLDAGTPGHVASGTGCHAAPDEGGRIISPSGNVDDGWGTS